MKTNKSTKLIILGLSLILLVSVLLLLPAIRELIIVFAERFIVHRALTHLPWHERIMRTALLYIFFTVTTLLFIITTPYMNKCNTEIPFLIITTSVFIVLCINVKNKVPYMGEIHDYFFWNIFTILVFVCFLAFVFKIHIQIKRKLSIFDNVYMEGFLIAFYCFSILLFFINTGSFIDERDNFQAGMLMVHGKILYRDYVSQHPPGTMFLCAFYAILGAVSEIEMRLLYYFTLALVFAGLYIRHSSYFGKKIVLVFFSFVFFFRFSGRAMVLGDSTSAICILVLLLEFLRYYHDKNLDFSRSIISGICIYGSITSIFLSVYSVFILGFAVFLCEIKYWRSASDVKFAKILRRYSIIIPAIILPFIITCLYFLLNNGFKEFIRQAYYFNREVYPRYAGMGSNIFQPIYLSFFNFLQIFINPFTKTTAETVGYCMLSILFVVSIVKGFINRKYFVTTFVFLYSVFCLSRGVSFHSIQYCILTGTVVLLSFIHIFSKQFNHRVIRKKQALLFAPIIFLVSFIISYKEQAVNNIDLNIIQRTHSGDIVFHDALSGGNQMYLIYKNRLPANRLPFLLAWYMEWYEDWCIEDLDKVSIAIWNSESEVWGYTNFQPRFKEKMENEFSQIEQNIWIRKTNKIGDY